MRVRKPEPFIEWWFVILLLLLIPVLIWVKYWWLPRLLGWV